MKISSSRDIKFNVFHKGDYDKKINGKERDKFKKVERYKYRESVYLT